MIRRRGISNRSWRKHAEAARVDLDSARTRRPSEDVPVLIAITGSAQLTGAPTATDAFGRLPDA